MPIGSWTLEKKGASDVPMVALDDKRQITAVLAMNSLGHLLPPQLLYAGLTERCHPRYADHLRLFQSFCFFGIYHVPFCQSKIRFSAVVGCAPLGESLVNRADDVEVH